MKKNWKFGKNTAWLPALLLLLAACWNKTADHSQHGEMPAVDDHSAMQHDSTAAVYTCSMHPQIIRSEPGVCPICGMDLVKKETVAHETHEQTAADLAFLLKPTNEYVLSAIKTIRPERKILTATVEAPGQITYDARRVQVISARFAGRIERLNVKYPFQSVQKGQRILDLYSPEIATAQQDLIFLLENDPGNLGMLENAHRRLALLGLTTEQIHEVETSRKPSLSLSIFSPFDGLVFEKAMPVAALNDDGMTKGMEPKAVIQPAPRTAPNSGELSLREGMYIEKGQRLFSLQSLATVWAMLEFYPSDASAVKVGQTLSIEIEPFDQPFSGKINYIEPQFEPVGKYLRARVYLENPGGKLKPGALLKATVQTGQRSLLWIPRAATLDLGRQHVVFLKKGDGFQSQKIETGAIAGDWIEVRSGISEADELAANAQFLMDSESFVKFN